MTPKNPDDPVKKKAVAIPESLVQRVEALRLERYPYLTGFSAAAARYIHEGVERDEAEPA